MNLNIFDRYLLIINIIALVIYGIKVLVYKHQTRDWFEKLCMFIVLLGGSAGILLMIIFFDRKAAQREYDVKGVYTLHVGYSGYSIADSERLSWDQIPYADFGDYLMQQNFADLSSWCRIYRQSLYLWIR